MNSWEYCILFQRKATETWLCHPSGEREKLKGNFMPALQRLGADGWEAVNYTPGAWPGATGLKSFDAWLGGDGFNREILLKRPARP